MNIRLDRLKGETPGIILPVVLMGAGVMVGSLFTLLALVLSAEEPTPDAEWNHPEAIATGFIGAAHYLAAIYGTFRLVKSIPIRRRNLPTIRALAKRRKLLRNELRLGGSAARGRLRVSLQLAF